MRRLLALFSDTHGGHKLSLMNPETWLLDADMQPYQPQLSAMQRWLWANYQDDLANVERLANGDRIDVLHVGDMTWGAAHIEGVVSTRMADQIIIGEANLEPWLALPNVASMTLITGTDSHELGESSTPILAARDLQRVHLQASVTVTHHLLAEVDGYSIDAAHHGPTKGKREWLDGNELRRYGQSMQREEVLAGNTPPNLVVRAHTHASWRETVRLQAGKRLHVTDLLICPAYCGLTPYARKVTQSLAVIGCGVWAVELVDGEPRRFTELAHLQDLRERRRL